MSSSSSSHPYHDKHFHLNFLLHHRKTAQCYDEKNASITTHEEDAKYTITISTEFILVHVFGILLASSRLTKVLTKNLGTEIQGTCSPDYCLKIIALKGREAYQCLDHSAGEYSGRSEGGSNHNRVMT